MNIVSFDKSTLKMNSGILEENFGKMSFASIITEEGMLVKGTKTGDSYSFDYSPWTFSDVQSFDTEEGRRVFFCGDSPFSKTPESLLNLLESENAFSAGFAAVCLLTDAARNKTPVPYTGAGGLFMEFSEDDFTALILPATLFTNAVAGKPDAEKALQINWWVNPTLQGVPALRFARSNIAYKILTGRLPYGATDTIERNADILDKKYLPLEMCITEINPELAKKINSELELNSAKVDIPGKKERKSLAAKINDDRPKNESDAQKAARLQEEYHKAVSVFPTELLYKAGENRTSVSDEEFSRKAAEYMAKKSARVNTKRRIRRNAGTIISVSLVALVVLIITINTIKTNKTDLTSKGLTAEQTAEAFYQSINALDTMFVSDHSKGKHAKNYATIVSQMYVIGKNRTAYSRDHGILNPAAYFQVLLDETEITEAGLYGITNLSVNGNPKEMDLVIPQLKDKIPAIEKDKNISVYNGMTSVQKVHFYMVHTEASEIFCEEHNDIVTMTFKKDKWIVTDIQGESQPVKINSSEFFKDYFTVMELTGQDPKTAVRILKKNYFWLPSQKAFDLETQKKAAEAAAFQKDMGLSAPLN